MSYTILRLILLVGLFYMTLLVIKSICQATFPASPHNRGEFVDYGAEFLQEIFAELRIYYPRFDYFVTTVNLVLTQVLLTVTMRYNVKTAMYAGGSIALAVIASAIVTGRLLFWVLWTMHKLINWTTRSIVDFLVDPLMNYLMDFYETLRIIWWVIKKIWNGKQNKPGNAFPARSRKQATRPTAEEQPRVPEPDHARPPSGDQGPKRGRSAPPRSAETDEELRDFARKMKRGMQDLYGDADTPRGRRGREEFVDGLRKKMGMEPIFQMQEAGDRITELSSDDETTELQRGSEQSMDMVKRTKSTRPMKSTETYKPNGSRLLKPMPTVTSTPVSYTHLTLPTKRIV